MSKQLQELNEKLRSASEALAHAAWVAHQQRVNLEALIMGAHGASGSELAPYCLRASLLEQTVFQDAYKSLNYQEIFYSEFLRKLRVRPRFLAACLTEGDRLGLPEMPEVVSLIFGGLYGRYANIYHF